MQSSYSDIWKMIARTTRLQCNKPRLSIIEFKNKNMSLKSIVNLIIFAKKITYNFVKAYLFINPTYYVLTL